MNTLFALMAEFGTTEIPLEKVAEKWWGLSEVMAKRAAASRTLPIPAYRGTTQKCPWIVKAQDLAEWIDSQHAKAKEEWRKVNGLERPKGEDAYSGLARSSSRAG